MQPERSDFDPLRTHYGETELPEGKFGRIIGFWCGLIPVTQTIKLGSPWNNPDLLTRETGYNVKLGNSTLRLPTMDANLFGQAPVRNDPFQGGVRSLYQYYYPRRHTAQHYNADVVAIYLHDDGRIALVVRTDNIQESPSLNMAWIIADIANALQILHRVRCAAESPVATYALLVELRYDDQGPDSIGPVRSGEWRLCPIGDEQRHIGPLVKSDPITVGPVLVGDLSKFPEVLRTVYTGIITSAGRRPDPDLVFEVTPEEVSNS